jgi:hypothetical protein
MNDINPDEVKLILFKGSLTSHFIFNEKTLCGIEYKKHNYEIMDQNIHTEHQCKKCVKICEKFLPMNIRPSWCTDKDCEFKLGMLNNLCGGKLPEPKKHGDVMNTHRYCLNIDGEIFRGAININDVNIFLRFYSEFYNAILKDLLELN